MVKILVKYIICPKTMLGFTASETQDENRNDDVTCSEIINHIFSLMQVEQASQLYITDSSLDYVVYANVYCTAESIDRVVVHKI
jgi:Fe-S cluster assembly iron-binding protein IscA